jgi:NADH-quinone oxidoreductase subunit B
MSTSALIPPAQVRKALRATELDNLVMTSTVEKALAWASSNSIWPFGFGLACCAMEMIGMITSARYDVARFGSEVVRATPRQSDLIIVSGRVAHKMAEPIRQLYEQMLEPKWVMAMGACSSTAGMFANYAVLQGVDKIIPVDVYVPGCPPRPEAVVEGLLTLQKKIRAGIPPAYRQQQSDA